MKKGQIESNKLIVTVIALVAGVMIIWGAYTFLSYAGFLAELIPGFNSTKEKTKDLESFRYTLKDGKIQYYDGISWLPLPPEGIKRNDKFFGIGQLSFDFYFSRSLPISISFIQDGKTLEATIQKFSKEFLVSDGQGTFDSSKNFFSFLLITYSPTLYLINYDDVFYGKVSNIQKLAANVLHLTKDKKSFGEDFSTTFNFGSPSSSGTSPETAAFLTAIKNRPIYFDSSEIDIKLITIYVDGKSLVDNVYSLHFVGEDSSSGSFLSDRLKYQVQRQGVSLPILVYVYFDRSEGSTRSFNYAELYIESGEGSDYVKIVSPTGEQSALKQAAITWRDSILKKPFSFTYTQVVDGKRAGVSSNWYCVRKQGATLIVDFAKPASQGEQTICP